MSDLIEYVKQVPTHPTPSNTLGTLDCIDRQFEEIVVEYPKITDEEHKGKPYYSIKYIENGKDKIIGFGTYKIDVFSRYIREYFISSVQPKRKRGKWIRTRTMIHDGELYCDQCEQEHPEQKKIWNFCPNCGCRMEEGDSDDN